MSCHLTFLPVGNADCTVVEVEFGPAFVVDVGHMRRLREHLKQRGIREIDRIYFTHDHHDHFPGLSTLVRFVDDWSAEVGVVRSLGLPVGLLRAAWQRREDLAREVGVLSAAEGGHGSPATLHLKQLEHALERLKNWKECGQPRFFAPQADMDARRSRLKIRPSSPWWGSVDSIRSPE